MGSGYRKRYTTLLAVTWLGRCKAASSWQANMGPDRPPGDSSWLPPVTLGYDSAITQKKEFS
jgi:hypothetical protein